MRLRKWNTPTPGRRELCQQVGDSPQLFPVLAGRWGFYFNRAKYQVARELGERCFTLTQRLQNLALLQEAHQMLGTTLLYIGELVWAHTIWSKGLPSMSPTRVAPCL